MFQTISTLVSLLVIAGTMAVIVASLREEWMALEMALRGPQRSPSGLPPRTHRVSPPHPARIIRLVPMEQAVRRLAAA